MCGDQGAIEKYISDDLCEEDPRVKREQLLHIHEFKEPIHVFSKNDKAT